MSVTPETHPKRGILARILAALVIGVGTVKAFVFLAVDYMRGLAQGGPTKSGHRTPAVVVNVPVNGTDEATVRANAWMFHQVLATGVHGILLCHADDPGAVRAFVEAVRLPIHKQGVGAGLSEGRRGVHGGPTAAPIWTRSRRGWRPSWKSRVATACLFSTRTTSVG